MSTRRQAVLDTVFYVEVGAEQVEIPPAISNDRLFPKMNDVRRLTGIHETR